MLAGFGIQAQQYANSTQSDSYEYYQYKYDKAKSGARIGSALAISGAGVFVLSTVIAVSAPTDMNGNVVLDDPMVVMAGFGFIFSFLSFNVGVPIWMSSLSKMRANRMQMERIKGYQPQELSLGVTKDGVGLILKL